MAGNSPEDYKTTEITIENTSSTEEMAPCSRQVNSAIDQLAADYQGIKGVLRQIGN